MGPGSFSLIIIWYFQALIYTHSLNTALFKLIKTKLNQMLSKPSNTSASF